MAASSIAASAQSALYGGAVASGSVFAVLQSAGVGLAGNAGIAAVAPGGSKLFQNTFSPCNGDSTAYLNSPPVEWLQVP